MKLRLIDDWRKAYTLFSVQAMSVATAILSGWALVPEDQKMFMPVWVTNGVHWAAVAVLILGIVGRVVSQTETDSDATTPGVQK